MINKTMIWPIGGICDGCPYYIEGSLERGYAKEKGLICGFHCRFDGFKGEGDCGANTLNPEVQEERIKKAKEEEEDE